MTVFMGTRQRYQLSRFELHSNYAIGFLIGMLLVIGISTQVQSNDSRGPLLWFGIMTPGLVLTKKGRGVSRRLIREVFYGSLFRVTGVFHTTGAKRVGK